MHSASFQLSILHKYSYTSKVAELGVRIGRIKFGIFDHVLDRLVRPICGCVVNIDGFQFNVER